MTQLANIKNTIILFICPSKILHRHCFYFLLGLTMIPKETGNNAYAKFWVEKQRVLWYFSYWLIPILNKTSLVATLDGEIWVLERYKFCFFCTLESLGVGALPDDFNCFLFTTYRFPFSFTLLDVLAFLSLRVS